MTLVELMVAASIMGILMAAVGSALVVAAKATPSDTSPERLTVRSNSLVQEIARELSQATAISSASEKGITFTVRDRTGDAAAETITYAWSGVAGEALTRTFNGSTVKIAADVTNFQLGFTTGTRSTKTTSAAVEGAEQVLFACYDVTSGGSLDFSLNGSSLAVQVIRPVFPANATSWRISRANLYIKRDGSALSSARLQIYKADQVTGALSGSVLGSVGRSELSFGTTYSWQPYSFGAMSLAPTDAAGIVVSISALSINLVGGLATFTLGSSASAGMILHTSNTLAEDGVSVLFTTNGGSSWDILWDNAIAIEVFGYITATGTSTSSVQTVDQVDITLAVTNANTCRTTAVVLPRPAYAAALPTPP